MALVIAPTRELALQINAVLEEAGSQCGIRCGVGHRAALSFLLSAALRGCCHCNLQPAALLTLLCSHWLHWHHAWGLPAAGKGVIVAATLEEAYQAVDDMMVNNAFGTAGGGSGGICVGRSCLWHRRCVGGQTAVDGRGWLLDGCGCVRCAVHWEGQ